MKAKVLTFLQIAALALAGSWVFSPALHGGWLGDDKSFLSENGTVRAPAGLWNLWFAPQDPHYSPVKTSVQWIQWRLLGLDPFGYHLTNLGLHLLSAWLLWRVLRQLGVRLAWLGGLLFVVHPVAVASVARISELGTLLALPLFLSALLAYLVHEERGKGMRHFPYFLSVACFFLALLSDASAAMFPATLLLHAWWKRGRITRADWRAIEPFFAILILFGMTTMCLQSYSTAGAPAAGLFSRLAVGGLAIGFYLLKCVAPFHLMPIYPQWAVAPPSPAQFLPWVLIGLFFWWGWSAAVRSAAQGPDPAPGGTKRAERHALFGLGFFLINLVPAAGFFPDESMRLTWVADPHAYLPLTGLIGLGVAALGALFGSGAWRRAAVQIRTAAGVAVAVLIAVLACASRSYAGVFASNEAFWNATADRNPDAWVAQYNQGLMMVNAHRLPEAIDHFAKALRIKPDYPEAETDLAVALCVMGRPAEAIPHFQRAVQLDPDSAQTRYNFGLALQSLGRREEARAQWEEAARLTSNRPGAQ